MNDSLVSRIGTARACCVATKSAHSLRAGLCYGVLGSGTRTTLLGHSQTDGNNQTQNQGESWIHLSFQ